MNSDRMDGVDRRTRLGYISLLEDEEKYVRETMQKMGQSGFNVGKNVGGKFSRLAILLLCDLYNSGKFGNAASAKDEKELRQSLYHLLIRA